MGSDDGGERASADRVSARAEVYVRSSAERDDGSSLFPGVWIETWDLMPGTGVWSSLSASARSRGGGAGRARACGRMMNQRQSPPLELLFEIVVFRPPPLFRRKLLDHEDAEAGFR